MFLFFAFLLFVVTFAELLLTAVWNATYFRFGIPIYLRTLSINNRRQTDFQDLGQILNTEKRLTPMVFKVVGDNECFFRYKLLDMSLQRRYFPLMHGVIQIQSNENRLRIIGWIDWTILVILVSAIYLSFAQSWGGLPMIVLFLGILYVMQVAHFNRAGDYLVNQWT